MTDQEANDLRCYAAEIIVRLYQEGQREQLHMLHGQAASSIRHLDKDDSPTADELLDWMKEHVGNIDFQVIVPSGVMTSDPWIATGSTFREALAKARTQLALAAP